MAGKQNVKRIVKVLQRMAVVQLILCITVKGGGVRAYRKCISGRLGRREKAKGGSLWG